MKIRGACVFKSQIMPLKNTELDSNYTGNFEDMPTLSKNRAVN